MTGSPSHLKIQRRIGIVWAIISALAASVSYLRLLQRPAPLSQYLNWNEGDFLNVPVNLGVGFLVFFASRIDHISMRILQVAVFALLGTFMTMFNTAWDAVGLTLQVYSIVLAIQFSLFERHFTGKMAVSLCIAFGSWIARTVIKGNVDFQGRIVAMVGVASYLALLWIAFAEPLRELADKARDLELEQRKDSVFVRFGRNVAGLVHNLRNLLTILYGLNSLLNQRAATEEVRELAVRQRAAFDRMTRMIERILVVVKAKQDTSVRSVDLNELLAGIVDFFCTDLDFKHGVHLQLALSERRPIVQAQPLELCEVVENLIRNSWESMTQRMDGTGNRIEIATFSGDTVGFAVSDNGPGIPGLDRCDDDECRRRFQVGRTTKEKGTGLGIPFILEAARANGWHVRIRSGTGLGTCTTIVLRGDPAQEDAPAEAPIPSLAAPK